MPVAQGIERGQQSKNNLSKGVVIMNRLLITCKEAAYLLSMSISTVYSLTQKGLVPSVKIAGSRRIPTQHLMKWIEQKMEEETLPRSNTKATLPSCQKGVGVGETYLQNQ